MDQTAIAAVTGRQRRFFDTGETLDIRYRAAALRGLLKLVTDHEAELLEALALDLGKPRVEAYMCELGLVRTEIRWLLRNLRRLTRDQRVRTPLHQFPARSFRRPGPYGVTLIMSPWNYPVLLTLGPLADALAAGNTAVIKPSAYAPATAKVLERLLDSAFPDEYVKVILGGREENAHLLAEKFDYIFFTGSKNVGKLVLEGAAKHLTPVTLELGGKSPCIIHSSADLQAAARRVVFGKFVNCGQTCIAPDYVLCQESVRAEFLRLVRLEVERQYGLSWRENPHYGNIVSEKHFDRLLGLLDPGKIFLGGGSDRASRKIEPTILTDVTWADRVMGEEIFGPILPVLSYTDIDEVIDTVRSHEKPLALYIFARDQAVIDRVTTRCQFGGGCINDVIVHLASTERPFGGVGESGMGCYHGQAGFDTFTHYKSILRQGPVELPIRYQPHTALSEKIIRIFLK